MLTVETTRDTACGCVYSVKIRLYAAAAVANGDNNNGDDYCDYCYDYNVIIYNTQFKWL